MGEDVVPEYQTDEEALARRAYEAWERYERAFDRLVFCYRERIARFCKHVLNNDDDGEDATQMAWQRALKSFATLDKPEAFKGWLFRIAKNCCCDIVTKRSRMVTNLQGEPNDPFATLSDPGNPVAEIHIAAAVREALCAAKEAIATRDELDRSIWDLMYVEGIGNIAEISRRLQKPENTIRSRVDKIRKIMAEIWQRVNNGM